MPKTRPDRPDLAEFPTRSARGSVVALEKHYAPAFPGAPLKWAALSFCRTFPSRRAHTMVINLYNLPYRQNIWPKSSLR